MCLLFSCARLFIVAFRSSAWKGLTSWLSFVMSYCELLLSHWYPGSVVVSIPDLCPLSYFSRTQHSDSTSDEAQTSNPSVPSLMLYQQSNCAFYHLASPVQQRANVINNKLVLTLPELSVILKNSGRHMALSRLVTLSISSLRNLDIEANKFYDRAH